VLVAPGDVAGLSAALDRLMGDPDLRDRLAAAGAARVRERFGFQATIDRLAQLLGGEPPETVEMDEALCVSASTRR